MLACAANTAGPRQHDALSLTRAPPLATLLTPDPSGVSGATKGLAAAVHFAGRLDLPRPQIYIHNITDSLRFPASILVHDQLCLTSFTISSVKLQGIAEIAAVQSSRQALQHAHVACLKN